MSKLRKSAQGQSCTVRIPGVCCWDDSTTVLAHLPGGGMGRKREDIHGAFACHTCHGALDGHIKTGFTRQQLDVFHLEGVLRTQEIWLEEGLITCA